MICVHNIRSSITDFDNMEIIPLKKNRRTIEQVEGFSQQELLEYHYTPLLHRAIFVVVYTKSEISHHDVLQ